MTQLIITPPDIIQLTGTLPEPIVLSVVPQSIAVTLSQNSLPGPKGDKGDKGDAGADGYTPIKGVDYFDGDKGDPGNDGVDGYTPIKGVDYFDGVNGTNGIDGYTPIKGVDYFDGEKGDKGDPGNNGADGSTWESVNGAPVNPPIGGIGSFALDYTTGDVYEFVSGDVWSLVLNITGDKGETGDKGDDGAKIITAAFSGNDILFTLDDASAVSLTDAKITLKGDQGDQGIQGPAGQDAHVYYGTGSPPSPVGLPDGALFIQYT